MKPETLEAIKNDADNYAYSKTNLGEGIDLQKRRDFIQGATKYAELLESERDKSEKLCEALQEIKKSLDFYPTSDKSVTMWEKIEKALTEYKTTSK